MKKKLFFILIVLLFPFKIYLMEKSSESNKLPETFYDQRSDEFLGQLDFSKENFKTASINFLHQRITETQKSINETTYPIKICNEAVFYKEASFVDSNVIKSFLKGYEIPLENCFMLKFANFVENNTTSLILMLQKKYYTNSPIESHGKNLGWEKISKEAFNEILKNYKNFDLLKVQESKNFAAILLEKLQNDF